MKAVTKAIIHAEQVLSGEGTTTSKSDPAWQAIIAIGEYIETNPHEIWPFILKWGRHPKEDIRMAIATCLLEHLLEFHFQEFFPDVKKACIGSKRFAYTYKVCATFGQSLQPDNSKAFVELKNQLS